ncbi:MULTISPECIES: hypothetical protein [Chroococcidiopsis]|jgi:hypothetical protein|uniref:Uncharacterized protein n=1 Tax=Chroococcidiopsis thermalis (strain PCC 7203) TaxID=251229 RepID=K9TZ40_CHRTP|nr:MULTISPECIES: hypothetical protein [Chroococcidiopsis]AFY88112.1 hypothetical protein Chro_2637 [Chroococcidiopsis thermalis PCC 7203]PSB49662.1 hypothetical protein C7B80_01125 [Cyanosarcina cf. burmensis CCALA 770]URD53033.1 hypothetical protein M5J74_13765 [Chroococcidiopsis sp. CCNUC1]
MAIFRQYIAPLLVVLVFLIALVAVSARIFIPADMAAPAPTEEVNSQPDNAQVNLTNAIASGSDVLAKLNEVIAPCLV